VVPKAEAGGAAVPGRLVFAGAMLGSGRGAGAGAAASGGLL
jgi:hypothetical protein